jgi:hypothetical protein
VLRARTLAHKESAPARRTAFAMAWVVKQWRMEGLERLLADEARDSIRVAREAAERDARRARRAANRTAADAGRELEALERLAAELQLTVRRRRSELVVPGASLDAGAAAARFDDARFGDPRGRAAAPTHSAADHFDARADPTRLRDARGRTQVSTDSAAAEPFDPDAGAAPVRGRPGRASLHGSPLGELFRATTAR